jgi:hypothetical protein
MALPNAEHVAMMDVTLEPSTVLSLHTTLTNGWAETPSNRTTE